MISHETRYVPAARGAFMRRVRWSSDGVVFGCALLLRVGWVLYRWAQQGPALEFPDEHLHWQLATNLIERGELVSDDGRYAARMPLYPLFLALFAWVGSSGILAARLAQAALGAAAAWATHKVARDALGPRAGWVAGLLACFDPFAVFSANLLLTEVPFTLLAVGLVFCAWRTLERPHDATRGQVAGSALLGAAAVMIRPSAVVWVLLLGLTLSLLDTDRRRAARRLALYAVTLAIAMLPWGLRNRAAVGAFAWLSTNGGVTLYDGQGPQARGDSNQAFLTQLPKLRGLDEVALDATLHRLAREQMCKDPARVARLAWTKLARTWNPVPNFAAYRGRRPALASAAFTIPVIVAAVVGLVRTRHRRRLHVMLWLPVIYFTLLHCVFVGSVRYRVPLMPFVQIAAAAVFALAAERKVNADAGSVAG